MLLRYYEVFLSYFTCIAHFLQISFSKTSTRQDYFWDPVFQEEIFVARAPGRLDVMGGIADYSGSLVLQVILLVLVFYC